MLLFYFFSDIIALLLFTRHIKPHSYYVHSYAIITQLTAAGPKFFRFVTGFNVRHLRISFKIMKNPNFIFHDVRHLWHLLRDVGHLKNQIFISFYLNSTLKLRKYDFVL